MATTDFEIKFDAVEDATAPTMMASSRDVDPVTGVFPSLQATTEAPPRVSVVIPTRGRPHLVERAVRSVLEQDFRDFEIVVVVDGPDLATTAMLRRLGDDRLCIVPLAGNVGGAEARNIGIRFSRGQWIALLDDDDEWLPGKLGKQHQLATSFERRHVFLASRFFERTENAERVLPRRMPDPGEPISEYLFVRRGWQSAEGFLQTSTWFASRDLMLKVPFTRGLKRCQDLDWLLHAAALPDVLIQVLPETLAIFHHEEDRSRVSRTSDWRFLYRWALANKRYFTGHAFSFFVATFCVPSAAKEREGRVSFFFLLRACVAYGSPSIKCLLLFLLFWFLPEERRRDLRARYLSLRGSRTMSSFSRSALPQKAGS